MKADVAPADTCNELQGGQREKQQPRNQPGTATSPSACWPMPSWPSSASPPATKRRRVGAVKGDLDPGLIPPTVPEARGLVLAMVEPEGRRRFLLGWSAWRRAHQAVAARCRKASLAAKRATRQAFGREVALKVTAIPPEDARLTDEQWALVRSLLPPQRGSIGRPPNDHSGE